MRYMKPDVRSLKKDATRQNERILLFAVHMSHCGPSKLLLHPKPSYIPTPPIIKVNPCCRHTPKHESLPTKQECEDEYDGDNKSLEA
jgi:hypothetical protein